MLNTNYLLQFEFFTFFGLRKKLKTVSFMKKKYLLVSLVLVAALAIVYPWRLSSHRVVPFFGECGDPTNPYGCSNPCTCAQSGCHPCATGNGLCPGKIG